MKKWLIPFVIFCSLFGIGIREYIILHNKNLLLLGEKNVVLLYTPNKKIFGMGRVDSSRAKAISREIQSFFTSGDISNIWEIPVGNEIKGGKFSIQRISKNLVRSVCLEQVIWWIGEDFSDQDQGDAVKTGVDFKSQWWVMMKNSIPDFLPIPTQGILFAGGRVPSKKTISFSQEKEIPLISVKETNGFMLSFTPEKVWELKMRN